MENFLKFNTVKKIFGFQLSGTACDTLGGTVKRLAARVSLQQPYTNRCGWVVKALDSYSRGPRFKLQLRNWQSWVKFSWFSSVPPGQCWVSASSLAWLLPSLCFPVCHSSSLHSMLCRGPRFKSRSGDWPSWQIFLSLSRWMPRYNLKIWSRPLPSKFCSSFTYHRLIRRYFVLVAEKASLNKLQTTCNLTRCLELYALSMT
jgi:hypothetical protein